MDFMKQKMEDVLKGIRENSCKGIVYAVVSTLLFSYAFYAAQVTLHTKHSPPQVTIHAEYNISVLELVFVCCSVEWISLLPFIIFGKTSISFGREKCMLVLQLSLSYYLPLCFVYLALTFIPSSIMLPISATCPVFSILFSYCIVKEKSNWFDGLCGMIAFTGVILIARPRFIFGNYGTKRVMFSQEKDESSRERDYLLGCTFTLIFAASRGLLFTLYRKSSVYVSENTEPMNPISLTFYPSLFGSIITPPLMVLSGESLQLPSTTYGIYSLFACAFTGVFGVLACTAAMKTVTATTFSLIRNLDIVWAILLQYMFDHIWPSPWSVGGGALIVMTTFGVCFRQKIIKCGRNDNGYEEMDGNNENENG